MTSLTVNLLEVAKIQFVEITDDTLSVDLSDGRTISALIAWYPRLLHGSVEERNSWRLIGSGDGIHWNRLDEDVSVKNILLGQSSGERQKSFQRWLNERQATG